ncbi:putative transcriptional regulator [Neisseria meningitidis FAM18]|uniref:Transcriptional regulator n=1 Tax=Neisseria meningitidis serogroup C / serotype 2a (strain ATCC 700532 / DSM 15464 / FAM18) TaxID=272831 RepID=A1KW43_NEIMF|nr:putative transcriptional regulator [Neisseria meningitidis FAM18]
MEKAEHLNSSRFVNLVKSGGGSYVEGSYRFDTLSNGISIHGGTVTARCDFCSSRLAEPYVSFVLLLEGSLDFGINRCRFQIDADGGKIVLIAVGEEVLFSRYLYRGGKTVKMTIKGMEQWLLRPEYARFAPLLYREPVRIDLPPNLRGLAASCLKAVPKGHLGKTLRREADVLRLLSDLWDTVSDGIGPAAGQTAEADAMPSEDFSRTLNAAFADGASQVNRLTDALNISERTLQRRMRDHFGITASEWLHHKQMQHALYLLQNGGKSIGETAYLCGYRHVSSFTQAFRQYFGSTPAETKKENR